MPKKKTNLPDITDTMTIAEIVDQPITETIETNFMPYAMSVIIARAIPEIDGFKPAHRKLLYTMYKKGLLTGPTTKSANIVGETMRLNPHGDTAIYETLVRLTRANETLLHPLVESKGSFGKHYSSDMKYAAARYTEAKLAPIAAEVFRGIEKDAVDFTENYDNTMMEPCLLPTAFPNILVNPNIGVAVSMTSQICSFNLAEICDGTIQMMKNPATTADQLLDIVKAPDFSGGGELIYDRDAMRELYETGHGSVRIRSRYRYDPKENCIEILEIPYSTTIESIIGAVMAYVKEGKLKEITDIRDEIDLNGFKLTIDLRRGTDPDKLMAKLFRLTPLEDSFTCNFNVLIDSAPKQLGVPAILNEWVKFRLKCVKRELTFELGKKEEKLHLLLGLGKLLLDIDKAIRIIRGTAKEADVVPNLMKGFEIDEVQAEYIAEIRLRNLNREYIINRTKEIEELQKDIEDLKKTIASELRLKNVISKQLKEIRDKYGKPRQTALIGVSEIEEYSPDDEIENYNVKCVLTKEGYFKKITLLSLRGNDEQKLKEGDEIRTVLDASNRDDIFFFTDHAQVYRAKLDDFEQTKAAALGDFVAAKLSFDEGEKPVQMLLLPEKDAAAERQICFFFENGKGARVPLSSYETKSSRRRLTGAFSSSSPIVGIAEGKEGTDVLLRSDGDRAILIDCGLVPLMKNRTAQGNILFSLKKGQKVIEAAMIPADQLDTVRRFRKNKLPSTGNTVTGKENGNGKEES